VDFKLKFNTLQDPQPWVRLHFFGVTQHVPQKGNISLFVLSSQLREGQRSVIGDDRPMLIASHETVHQNGTTWTGKGLGKTDVSLTPQNR
jgi:hypothetical protein